jgi:hypothetical protein
MNIIQTFAELQAGRPFLGANYSCVERANAEYTVQAAGYVALAGDVTFANSLIGALTNGFGEPEKLGAFADSVTNDAVFINNCIQRYGYANLRDGKFAISQQILIDADTQALLGWGSALAEIIPTTNFGTFIKAAKASGPLRGLNLTGFRVYMPLSNATQTSIEMDGVRNFAINDVIIDRGFQGFRFLGCSQGTIDNALVIFENDNGGNTTGRNYITIEETTNANIVTKHCGDLFFSNFNGRCGGTPYTDIGIEINSGDGIWFNNYHIGNCLTTNLLIDANSAIRCTGLKFSDGWHDIGSGKGTHIRGTTPSTIGNYTFNSVRHLGGGTGDVGMEIDGSAGSIVVDGADAKFSGYLNEGVIIKAAFSGDAKITARVDGNSLVGSGTRDGIKDESATSRTYIKDCIVSGVNHRYHINAQQSKVGLTICDNDVSINAAATGSIAYIPRTGIRVENNKGYNPTNSISPAVGASPFTYQNTRGYPIQVLIYGGTGVSFNLNGVSLGGGKSDISTILAAGDNIIVTYSTTPFFYAMGL